MNLGLPEMLMILAVALVVFGPKRLPEIGKSLGQAVRDFKKAMNEPFHENDKPVAQGDATPLKLEPSRPTTPTFARGKAEPEVVEPANPASPKPTPA